MKTVLREGDCLYIDALDRLGRDYDEITSEWKQITRTQKCDIVALDNSALFDSRKFREMGELGRLMEDQFLSLLAYVADSERKKILRRQREGIDTAKKAGVKFGRPLSIQDWDLFDRTAKHGFQARFSCGGMQDHWAQKDQLVQIRKRMRIYELRRLSVSSLLRLRCFVVLFFGGISLCSFFMLFSYVCRLRPSF